jgi:TRAP-type mannitol/chloroaromatic compound transport system permease small subunit
MHAAVEWDMIGRLLWAAPAAALAVSITFSLVIMGWARATDARRAGHATTATLYSVLAFLAALGFVAVVVFGVGVIVNK